MPKPGVFQFSIINGDPIEHSPGVGIFDEWWFSTKSALYIVVETLPYFNRTLSQRLVTVIANTFNEQKVSVTGKLKKALFAACDELEEENRTALPDHRMNIRATAVVLRRKDAYIAQIGGSPVYAYSEDGLRQLAPQGYSEASEEGDGIGLYHCYLEGTERLLVTSERFSELFNNQSTALLLSLEPDESLRELYFMVRRESHFSALLIDMSGRHAGTSDSTKLGLVKSPRLKDEPKPPADPVTVPSKVEEPPAVTSASKASSAKNTAESSWPHLSRALRLPLIGLIVTLAFVILGLTLWYLPGYWQKQAEANLANILEQAQIKRSSAMASTNMASARKDLEEAIGLVDRLMGSKEEAKALELKERFLADLNRVNGVTNLPDLREVLDFSKLTESTDLRGVLLADKLYLLDLGGNRIMEGPLAGDGRPAGDPSSLKVVMGAGAGKDVLSAIKPRVSFWMPAGGNRNTSNLLVFDGNRTLLEYGSQGEVKKLVVRSVDSWQSLQSAKGFNGNLYVLDPKANQVWRYLPTESGYDNEREAVLYNAEMQDAVDFAIDGRIYVLTSAGKILKFTLGREQEFPQEGIDKPLSNPTAIFTSPSSPYVYVADSGNRRIALFDKEGVFKRQLISPDLEPPRGVFVDESKGRIYIISRQKLYQAALPK